MQDVTLAAARRRWPDAVWLDGNGPWALVSRCPPAPSVRLFATREEAADAKARIDDGFCGSACLGPMGHAVEGGE